jgi:hypothetical protein
MKTRDLVQRFAFSDIANYCSTPNLFEKEALHSTVLVQHSNDLSLRFLVVA